MADLVERMRGLVTAVERNRPGSAEHTHAAEKLSELMEQPGVEAALNAILSPVESKPEPSEGQRPAARTERYRKPRVLGSLSGADDPPTFRAPKWNQWEIWLKNDG